MNRNLCKTVISGGGKLIPLLIPTQDSKGLGLMNPSILVEPTKILLCLRNINYTLYHCEGQQLFNNRWGPLSYLHPENDMHLRTWNYMCELNPESLEIEKHWLTNTADFDNYEPLWDFVGLEDARLVRWNGKLYQCGVRRDTTPNGVGRMEVCEIQEFEDSILEKGESKYKEVSRARIEPPNNPTSYCEKNWMPVLDMPMHFVKWCNPTEVVKVNRENGNSKTVFLSSSHIPDVPDFRGGSQIINYKGFRLALVHEVNLFKNKLQQKDATYTHRFIVWDKDWNIVKLSDSFSIMDGEIEFSCGIALYKKDLLLSFGFQDNAAYILKIPENMIDEITGFTKRKFNWGLTTPDDRFEKRIYQQKFDVEENDIVFDMNAGIGDFVYSILSKKPKFVIALESFKSSFDTLQKNTIHNQSVICLNKYLKLTNLLELYNIPKIDFLKSTAFSFSPSDVDWIKSNVKKLSFQCFTNEIDSYKEQLGASDDEVFIYDLDPKPRPTSLVSFNWDNRPKVDESTKPKIRLAVKDLGVPMNKTNI